MEISAAIENNIEMVLLYYPQLPDHQRRITEFTPSGQVEDI